jgi:phenylacetate-coenzyme A ligase PaaK-like adenylate-forming protein
MRQLRAWEQLDRASFHRLTAERLREALQRAAAEVPLYGTGKWRAALTHQRQEDIRAWPVLERDVVRTQGRDLLSDRGTLSPDPCSCGLPQPVLAELEGRAADLFVAADGRLVHGSALGDGLKTFLSRAPAGAVGQVLFRQVDPHHWEVLVETGDGFDEMLAKQLEALVQATFGKNCAVEIRPVDTVPRERSGKFRYYSR